MNGSVSFGQWLKQRRKALDLTREALAQRIGCAVVTLNKIEADERRPSHQLAELLSEHLNIPLDERPAFISFARAKTGKEGALEGALFHAPTNLPSPPTSLIGRTADIAALRKRLLQPQTRLLTLTGPPGIGKTRLALQLAAEVRDNFPQGVFLVPLAPVTDASLVLTMCAGTLGVPEGGPQTTVERLKAFLREKQILLVLDNFEQVLAAAAQIADLLAACPWLKLLVTSRAPLRIRPERQFPVTPLALPDLVHLPDADTVSQYSAVALFVERAQAVKPDFALTEANAHSVAAICTRLDGLPLAIELISARIKLLPPDALLERMRGQLLLRSDGLSDLESRHRTLNNAIEWSYLLLSEDEQLLFRRLGVFVGGWTLEAAEAVCLEHLSLNLLEGMASLLDKSLIKQTTSLPGEPRFMLLETIREYALHQLIASQEFAALRQRHLDYFVKLAEGAEAHSFGENQIIWFDRLEDDLDNLRAALAWSAQTETGLRLVGALGWFFSERTHWNEGADWFEQIVAANPDAPPLLRAKALFSQGALLGLMGGQQAPTLCRQALALAREANDRWAIAWSLCHLGLYTYHDPLTSVTALEESLAVFRELGDPMGLSHTLIRLPLKVLEYKEDYAYARALVEEAVPLAHQAGDKVMSGWTAFLLGRLALLQDGALEQAKRHLERSLAFFRAAHFQLGTVLQHLAAVEQALGNLDRAQLLYREAVISGGRDRPPSIVLAGMARFAIAHRQFKRAAILLGTVDETELPLMIVRYSEILTYKSDIALTRTHLGETAFAAAWAEGQALTTRQLIAYVLETVLAPSADQE